MAAAEGLSADLGFGRDTPAVKSMLEAIERSHAIVEFSIDGRVLSANENFLRAVGYTADEVVGIHHSIFVEPSYATSADYRAFWSRLRRGEFIVDRFRRIAKGGREIWIQASYNPVMGQDGLPVRVVKFATDITDQEIFARDARGQLAALSQSTALMEFDPRGIILSANENYCRMVGYAPAELIGRHHAIFVEPDYASSSDYRQFWSSLSEGHFQAGKFLRVAKGGRLVWIQAAYNPIPGGDGKPTKIVKLASDITAHELLSRDAHSQITAISKSLATIEFMIDGTILTANENFCRIMGYRQDEIRARHHSIFVDATEAASLMYHEFWRDLAAGIYRSAKYKRIAKDGRAVWIQASYNPVMDDRGRIMKIVKYATDVTEQEQAEREAGELREINADLAKAKREAEEAAQLKTQFLATMSHEIRTPMNGVLGMLEVALRREKDSEQREHLIVARDSAASLLRILNDILDYSKLEAGQLAFENVALNPRQVIDEVASMFAAQAQQKGLMLEQMASDAMPQWILGDPMRLKQVLSNLVSNAIKFTQSGSVKIGVDWLDCGAYFKMRVTVTDTGIGVDKAAQSRLFKRFSQADASTTRRFGGTGLGLAICRELVTGMGGTIGVTSAPEHGSTFWLDLPALISQEPGPAGSERHVSVVKSVPRHILIADDNAVNRRILRLLLEPEGHRLAFAENGAQAIEANDSQRFDLILMDVSMPVMDGPTAARRIREGTGPAALVPIIAVTANAMPGDKEDYLAAGMTDYLSKPIDAKQLLAMVRRHGGKTQMGSAITEWRPAGQQLEEAVVEEGVFDALQRRLDDMFSLSDAA